MDTPRRRHAADKRKAARTSTAASHRDAVYRALRLPSGMLLSIEVRLGARVLRTIPCDCDEARALLQSGQVVIVEAEQ